MKLDLGVSVAFDIISGPVEFFYHGLLLVNACDAIEAIGKILFGFGQINIVTHQFEPDGLFKKMIEIAKKLFLFFAAKATDLFYHFVCATGPVFKMALSHSRKRL